MNEEDQAGSLADQAAAWIPPWQRATAPAPAADASGPDDTEDDDDDDDEGDVQQPETDRLGIPEPVASVDAADPAPDDEDDDEDDVQQPETDRFDAPETGDDDDPLARAREDAYGATGSATADGSADEDDEDEDDVQQPETDFLAELDGLDEADALPEADVGADAVGAVRLTDVADGGEPGAAGADGNVPSPGGEPAAARTRESVDRERPANLAGALEAILLVVDEPVAPDVLAEVLAVSIDEANAALAALAGRYADESRGFDLRRAAGGWRLYTRNEYASYVERFVLDGQSVRLTQAALETLAVIAYQQPVTRSRMSAIRGVNCDGVVRTLANRGLIEECGTQPDSGAFLYRTTPLFLEKLGLDSLDELPPLAPFLPDDVNGFADA